MKDRSRFLFFAVALVFALKTSRCGTSANASQVQEKKKKTIPYPLHFYLYCAILHVFFLAFVFALYFRVRIDVLSIVIMYVLNR